jgi:5-methylcytosine-specific restriction endonuclease McrA
MIGAATQVERTGLGTSCHGGVIERVTAGQLKSLIEAQGFRCNLTGRMLDPSTASVDHITPLCEGGDHVITNLQILHKDVNAAKGTLSHDEFVSMCREVVDWIDKRGDKDPS